MPKFPLILATLLTFGCAAKKMVTRNADVLVQYQIEKRLPLYSPQKDLLTKDVKAFLNGQKEYAKKNLPLITKIELDPNKVDAQYEELQVLYRHFALEFSKILSKYMALLDSKQQKEFNESLEGDIKHLKRSTAEDEVKKVISRIELLFGSVTDKQTSLIKEKQSYFESKNKLRISRKAELNKEFSKIYKKEITKEAREIEFNDAFLKYQESYPDNSMNKELITKLISILNDEQKATFKKKINEAQEIVQYYLENQY